MRKLTTKKVTMESLALMIGKGFRAVDKRLEQMDKKIDGVETRLDKKINDVEERLTSRIQGLERRMDTTAYNKDDKIYVLETRIARVEKKVGIEQ